MKTKINSQFFIFKKWLRYSLLVILVGIFLLPNTAYYSFVSEEKIVELTNQERINNGLNIVTANQLLAKSAYEKGRAILEAQTFRHNINDKKFSVWVKDAGYQYSYIGENLAIDFVTSEGVIKAWLDSTTHKKNILNQNFSEIGVAVLEGEFQGNNTTLVVQIFGAPLQTIITNKKLNNTFLTSYPNLSTLPMDFQPIDSNYLNKQLILKQDVINNNGNQAITDFTNYKMAENLLIHSIANSINNNFTYLPTNSLKYTDEYDNLYVSQKADKLLLILGGNKLTKKTNFLSVNNLNKKTIVNYLILFLITLAAIINIYLYYSRCLPYLKHYFIKNKIVLRLLK